MGLGLVGWREAVHTSPNFYEVLQHTTFLSSPSCHFFLTSSGEKLQSQVHTRNDWRSIDRPYL